MKYIVDLSEVNSSHVDIVGGKNASTGEMIQHLIKEKIKVPGGFATTVAAYQNFLAQNQLDKKISQALKGLKNKNVTELNKVSASIRRWIVATSFSAEFEKEILAAYKKIKSPTVAVRSSATAEDLANASFAGAQETFLNIKGNANLLHAIKLVYASLFTSRAINYRHTHGFVHEEVSLSVGIQHMIRSDKAVSGVMFTLDTESGFDKVILITAAYGLGEAIVQGQVNPDEFVVYKPALTKGKYAILQRRLGDKAIKMIYGKTKDPKASIREVAVKKKDQQRFCLSDREVESLARQASIIEKHYGRPMDIEWAKDGVDGQLYILQARPETVKSIAAKGGTIETYSLTKKGEVLATGQSVGQGIGNGAARVILDPTKHRQISPGEVLVTDMTDPDWEPIMKQASAIVTNRGGRTCHAAIVARELGIPAIVGCGDATKRIKQNDLVTVSCAEGQTGYIYRGKLPFKIRKIEVDELPKLPLNICINMGNPDRAFATQSIPNGGVGLARLEFIISNRIGIHPSALLNFDKLPKKLKQEIQQKISAYPNPVEFYIERLREGVSTIAAAFFPKPVIFRFSDFKSNEYANLLGGSLFEPNEENPMLGFRGASRYVDDKFKKCFELECKAFKRVRDEMGLTNAQLMIPFVRTVKELQAVVDLLEQFGLKRGRGGLKLYMMCEIPSNVLLAKKFLQYVDGFSIGSNDLTQLVLGVDRDSSLVASLFDERDHAVKAMLKQVIADCNELGKYIGICGQAPSDHPDMAKWLMNEGIHAMSLNPDTIIETWMMLASVGAPLVGARAKQKKRM